MEFLRKRRLTGLTAALATVCFICGNAFAADTAAAEKSKSSGEPKTETELKKNVADNNAKIASELDQLSTGLAPNSGKHAVAKRLAALFKNSADPMISTKKFVPAPPYISMQDLPQTDKLIPQRTLIIYRLRFMQADAKTQDAIEGLVGDSGTVEFHEKQNMVIINVLKDRAATIKAALIALDQPLPQVLVETQVIEILVEHGQERDVKLQYSQRNGEDGAVQTVGFNLTNPGQDTNSSQQSGFDITPISKTGSDGGYKQLNAAVRWLATSTDSKILAAPNIIAQLGVDAKMTTGEEIPYAEAAVTNTAVSQNIKFKKTGINLSIKPTIINEDTVRLEIKPEIILAVRYQTFIASSAASTVPVVSIRNISTTLTAADGEIIMLGGLYSSETSERLRKTPFFSDLPLVGALFTAKSLAVADKQLLFFMKIHILKSPYSVMLDVEKNAEDLKDMGRSLRVSGTMFTDDAKEEKKIEGDLFSLETLKDPDAFIEMLEDGKIRELTADETGKTEKKQSTDKAASSDVSSQTQPQTKNDGTAPSQTQPKAKNDGTAPSQTQPKAKNDGTAPSQTQPKNNGTAVPAASEGQKK